MSFDGLVRPAAAKAPAAPENSEELLQKLQSSDPPPIFLIVFKHLPFSKVCKSLHKECKLRFNCRPLYKKPDGLTTTSSHSAGEQGRHGQHQAYRQYCPQREECC